ncbi:MAG: molybdopterin-dependent oxidoreductase [Actinomycetota bacterium]
MTNTTTLERDVPSSAPRTPTPTLDGLAGFLSAGMALGVSELLSGFGRTVPSLLTSVGTAVIDLGPKWFVDIGIDVFGTNDKPALIVGTVILTLLAGIAVGSRARRLPWLPVLAYSAFALIGALAAARDELASTSAGIVVAVITAASGLLALRWLLRAIDGRVYPVLTAMRAPDTAGPIEAPAPGSRREFLLRAGVVAGIGVVTPLAGRRLRDRFAVEGIRSEIQIATPTASGARPVGLDVPGISPLFTPNDDFYRIDTALVVPQVNPNNWELRITGDVEEEISFSYDELLDLSVDEYDVTIACVSNEVGGGLIGNARWQGVPIQTLLDRARPTEAAGQIVGTSVDGFTAGFPIELAYDGRPAVLAVGMNGEPLPVRHGFPARLIVSGIYGYVSATKWLSEIRVAPWDGVDGYWIPRGWAKEGPIKLQSRIDVPRNRARVDAGPVAVAGVAWAQQRGIEGVQVRIDGGEWVDAELGDEVTIDTWRQWLYRWDAEPGEHQIEVRAIDVDGEIQTAIPTPPAPDGAAGHHRIRVDVS